MHIDGVLRRAADEELSVAELAQSFGRRGVSPKVLATSATLGKTLPGVTAALLILASCSLCGCNGDSASETPRVAVADQRSVFAQQVRQVRDGETDWVVIDDQVITDPDLKQLASLTNLRELIIEQSQITDDGLSYLTDLRGLEHLRIRGARITDQGIERLLPLEQLRILNLPQAWFTDTALQDLSGLEQLELLRFGSPHVTDDGLQSVACLPNLRFLHIIDTPITDGGLRHLETLTELESLYLDGTRVSDEGIERLLSALPELHLHIDQQHHDTDPRKDNHAH
jgi:hypothetical protein